MMAVICPKCGYDRDIIKTTEFSWWCPACWSSWGTPLGTPSKYISTEV